MSDPVLHLLAGPNGAGKTTLYDTVLAPITHLEFVSADVIAATGVSFVTESVFSHESKLQVVQAAVEAGYLVTLHVVMVPEALAVARVASRVAVGGHAVPKGKIRERYRRLWPLVAAAIRVVETTVVYDNSRAETPFRVIATFERGSVVGELDWPAWTPEALRNAKA